MKMHKTLFTLLVGNYPRTITDLTLPLLQYHAHKIGAKFQVISERKFPEHPIAYEKLQIFELGRDNDWNIFVDVDTIIRPDLFDLTEYLSKDQVLLYSSDFAPIRLRYDRFFRRDGRNLTAGNFFMIASDWCHEFWEPLQDTDITVQDAIAQIFPITAESAVGHTPEHFIDEYVIARNMAKYGLHYTSYLQLMERLGRSNDIYLWHQSLLSQEEKVRDIQVVLDAWGIPIVNGASIPGTRSTNKAVKAVKADPSSAPEQSSGKIRSTLEDLAERLVVRTK
jgi:hypothetical protein